MLVNTKKLLQCQGVPYEQKGKQNHQNKGFAYIETYGCQMNFADTEVVAAILAQEGYGFTQNPQEADVIFINTCSIRENAEQKIWNRLKVFRQIKQKRPHVLVGVLGCMAERLKKQLLEEEQCVDMVVGPDAYRSIPKLIEQVHFGEKAVNVLLSREETYADIAPLRLHSNGVTAFLSIMRGCNNMCTFCVVPFTRGRERSRDPDTIVKEAQQLFEQGYRDITLLGQNVDSYNYKGIRFAQLLAMVAEIHPKLRVRFTTSHPKDMTDDVLYTMARYENLCKYIHLPVQSGSNRILSLMRRGYTREWYLNRIERIRSILPDCAIATDIIAGFCSETEEDHQQTLDLMERVRFNSAFMFYYSERPGTYAARKLKDDVPLEVKKRRLQEIIRLQQQHSLYRNREWVGKTVEVLIEGDSKRSKEDFSGRTSQNIVVVFPKHSSYKVGDYVRVRITSATSATLKGEIVS